MSLDLPFIMDFITLKIDYVHNIPAVKQRLKEKNIEPFEGENKLIHIKTPLDRPVLENIKKSLKGDGIEVSISVNTDDEQSFKKREGLKELEPVRFD